MTLNAQGTPGESSNSASPYGRWFEEFAVGQSFDHYVRKTITEADNHLFCLLTMNHHPAHIDNFYAASSRYGRPLVVGTLVLSVCVGISVLDLSGKAVANLSYDNVEHLGPVFHGDTLRVRSDITSVRQSQSHSHSGIVSATTTGSVVDRDDVIRFSRSFLVPSDPAKDSQH